MKKIILFIIVVIIFSACQDPWATYPYTTFDQAIEEITVDYGDPAIVRDTVFYDDGTVREREETRYYTTIQAEV